MITVNITGLDATFNAMTKQLPAEVEQVLTNELRVWATETAGMAQNLAPVNLGHLRGSIAPKSEGLSASVTVNADYAAYLVFGTKAFAEAYVNTLPEDWREMAATFKGGGGGSFIEMVNRLTEWVHSKGLGSGFAGVVGLSGTYSVKSRQRTGNKSIQASQDRQLAYLIARKILRVGIKPQRFLFQAYETNTKILIDNLTKQFGA